MHILYMTLFVWCTAWLDACQSTIAVNQRSLVCDSSVLHTGKAASCSCRQYRDDTVRDAKRSSRLSRRFLRQNEGRQRRLQVVVREQLGPQLGNKVMMELYYPKGSVAELVGRQDFCVEYEGSNPLGGTWKMKRKWRLSLGRWMISIFCFPVILCFFWNFENKWQWLDTMQTHVSSCINMHTMQNMENMYNTSINMP